MANSCDEVIESWVRAMETREIETRSHAIRVMQWTATLATACGFPEDELPSLQRGALLHDIGQIAMPDSILRKSGPLTKSEWELVQKHPVYAHEWLQPISSLCASLEIPLCHHEAWDGSGYPRGLKGEEIPLGARIFAVIDVWDALLSDRPYRKAWQHDKALEIIQEMNGVLFDPRIVEVFLPLVQKGGFRD